MGGAFAKIAGAKTSGGGNFILDGNYKLLIEKLIMEEGHNGDSFVAEFRVIESTANGALDDAGKPVVPNPPGSTCSLVCNITKFEAAAGNALKMVAGALGGLGYTKEQVTPDVMGEICSPNNPMRGLGVICETYRGVNKGKANPANKGKALTLCNWKSIEQTEEEMLAQRAYLDNTPPAVAVAPVATAAVGIRLPSSQPAVEQPAPAVTPTVPTAQVVTSKPAGILGRILGGAK